MVKRIIHIADLHIRTIQMHELYKNQFEKLLEEISIASLRLNNQVENLLNMSRLESGVIVPKMDWVDVNEIVYADSAEPKSIAELNSYGHNVLPVSKGKDSILFGLNLINQNKVYVTSRSKNLINELRNYIWQTDKTGIKMNRPIDAYNHAIDAMRYAMTSQLENPHKGNYFIY